MKRIIIIKEFGSFSIDRQICMIESMARKAEEEFNLPKSEFRVESVVTDQSAKALQDVEKRLETEESVDILVLFLYRVSSEARKFHLKHQEVCVILFTGWDLGGEITIWNKRRQYLKEAWYLEWLPNLLYFA